MNTICARCESLSDDRGCSERIVGDHSAQKLAHGLRSWLRQFGSGIQKTVKRVSLAPGQVGERVDVSHRKPIDALWPRNGDIPRPESQRLFDESVAADVLPDVIEREAIGPKLDLSASPILRQLNALEYLPCLRRHDPALFDTEFGLDVVLFLNVRKLWLQCRHKGLQRLT